MNYNFTENWQDIIVPLLTTNKVKKSIKNGILGYMNNALHCEKQLTSYQDIYDYFNKKNRYHINKHCSPADYCSSDASMMSQQYWEDELIEKLEKNGMVKPFEYDDSIEDDDIINDKYEDYREQYLQPILKPYIENYKKNHMDSYRLWGGCHWWNPTFGLTLAQLVLPNEKWIVRESEYHTTVVNEDETKVFDILYYDEDDETLGGKDAYEKSGMTIQQVRERNKIINAENIEKKVNNGDFNQIYDDIFHQIKDYSNNIATNMIEINKQIEGLDSILLDYQYDDKDEEKNDRIFEFHHKIVNKLFPNAKFSMCLELKELDEVVTKRKKIKFIQTFNCCCYGVNQKKEKTFIIKSKEPMTRRYIINELIKQDFTIDCDHIFLEHIEVKNGIVEYFMGS